MGDRQGSMNYECRRGEGWAEGEGYYSTTEPHHNRSMAYVNMHNPAREALLRKMIETRRACKDVRVWVQDEFSAMTSDAAADYDAADTAGTIKSYLMVSNGNVIDRIELNPGKNYDLLSVCGWDEVELEDSRIDVDVWIANYYDAILTRR